MKKSTLLVCAGALVVSTAAITAQVTSQNETGKQMQQHQQEMPEWMKYGQPGKHHERLDPFIGTWDQTVKMWMSPGGEAQTSESTATYEWIMGGRFVKGTYSGSFNGQPFKGMDLLGYDNFRQQYISLWIDNMSSAFMTATGSMNADHTKLTMTGTHDNVMTGQRNQKFKTVTRIESNDRIVYESYGPGPDGTMYKTLEVVSTRR